MKDKVVRIGKIGIDTGQVIISDPAYVKTGRGTELPSYTRISKVSLAGKNQLKNRKGIPLSVVSNTGVGDGVYPVFAVKGQMGMFGKRTKALIVLFDDTKGVRKSVVSKLKKVI